jgi:hypothetical protein
MGSATETVTVSGEFTGSTTIQALEASGVLILDTSVSSPYNASVTQSYESTARGTVTGGTSMSGTIEVYGANAPYTVTWSAQKQ